MDLDERGQPDALRGVVQIAELRAVESGHDEEHGVGARRARFPELILLEDELLAEQRDVDGRAHGHEILEAPRKYFWSVSTEMAAAPDPA